MLAHLKVPYRIEYNFNSLKCWKKSGGNLEIYRPISADKMTNQTFGIFSEILKFQSEFTRITAENLEKKFIRLGISRNFFKILEFYPNLSGLLNLVDQMFEKKIRIIPLHVFLLSETEHW